MLPPPLYTRSISAADKSHHHKLPLIPDQILPCKFLMTPENAESSHNPEWWWGEKWCCLLSSCGCITGIMFHDGGSGVEGWKNGWKANVTNGGGGCGTAAGVSGPGRNWGKMPGAETLFLPSVRYCAALLLKLLPLHRVTKQRGWIYITSDICLALNLAV